MNLIVGVSQIYICFLSSWDSNGFKKNNEVDNFSIKCSFRNESILVDTFRKEFQLSATDKKIWISG